MQVHQDRKQPGDSRMARNQVQQVGAGATDTLQVGHPHRNRQLEYRSKENSADSCLALIQQQEVGAGADTLLVVEHLHRNRC